jgi:hypothetical protein
MRVRACAKGINAPRGTRQHERPERAAIQLAAYARWLDGLRDANLAVVECGAGTAVPAVPLRSEQVARRRGATLVRINPREPNVPPGQHIGLAQGAAAALAAIEQRRAA